MWTFIVHHVWWLHTVCCHCITKIISNIATYWLCVLADIQWTFSRHLAIGNHWIFYISVVYKSSWLRSKPSSRKNSINGSAAKPRRAALQQYSDQITKSNSNAIVCLLADMQWTFLRHLVIENHWVFYVSAGYMYIGRRSKIKISP